MRDAKSDPLTLLQKLAMFSEICLDSIIVVHVRSSEHEAVCDHISVSVSTLRSTLVRQSGTGND